MDGWMDGCRLAFMGLISRFHVAVIWIEFGCWDGSRKGEGIDESSSTREVRRFRRLLNVQVDI